MKNSGRFIKPIIILVLSLGVWFAFQVYVKDKINTVEVLVVNKDIGFKSVITEQDLNIVNMKKSNVINGYLKPEDINLVVNKNAAIDIKKGTQLYEGLIDKYDLIPNEKEGEFVASVPSDWIFSVPGSLRKTFIADFYALPDKEQMVVQSLVNESNGESNKDATKVVASNSKPVISNVRVASVKDSSNGEVKETTEDVTKATGTISGLEIIADDDMLQTLSSYVEKGYKFYIVYKYDR